MARKPGPGIPSPFVSAALAAVVTLIALVSGSEADAYVGMRLNNGSSIAWSRDRVTSSFRVDFALNPSNRIGLSTDDVRRSVTRSLQRWKEASRGTVLFDLYMGTDARAFAPTTAYDQYSRIYFTSQMSQDDINDGYGPSPSVIGMTQVWYNTNSGQILEADLALNDTYFTFTTRPSDTTGSGNNYATSGGMGRPVYLDNVLTHELGHAFGLSHSGVTQSTMLAVEAAQQAHLSCDDRVGIQATYPTAGISAERGAIAGRVISESGAAVSGAHVLAISRRRGVVLTSSLSDSAGNYVLSGLEAGDYAVAVEPFAAGSSSVPGYYSGMNPWVCGGSSFQRSFQTENDGHRLRFTTARSGIGVNAGTIVARCSGVASSGGATELYAGQGTVDVGAREITLRSVSGVLEVKLLSHTLSFLNTNEVSLIGPDGRSVSAQIARPSFSGVSGYYNWDTHLRAENLPLGDYRLQIRPSAISAGWAPNAGLGGVDYTQTYAVLVLQNEGAPLAAELPWNARCEAADSGEAYAVRPGSPPRGSGAQVGFCGSLTRDSKTAPPSAGDIAGWFLSLAGWAIALAVGRFAPRWVAAVRGRRSRTAAEGGAQLAPVGIHS